MKEVIPVERSRARGIRESGGSPPRSAVAPVLDKRPHQWSSRNRAVTGSRPCSRSRPLVFHCRITFGRIITAAPPHARPGTGRPPGATNRPQGRTAPRPVDEPRFPSIVTPHYPHPRRHSRGACVAAWGGTTCSRIEHSIRAEPSGEGRKRPSPPGQPPGRPHEGGAPLPAAANAEPFVPLALRPESMP